ncbi:hypothetical protein [Actinocatenispora comari]|uniref:Uncharacterized protein n=1 Tax=Actinocatenispora comari TaxID=2807577 RepID=A0A8J4EP05_9ACTN|nr:hypothetical protein [Actinocatenispora comari]GIL30805.1 hypothetical protein NUM_60590 [Actinocatenispora comari]
MDDEIGPNSLNGTARYPAEAVESTPNPPPQPVPDPRQAGRSSTYSDPDKRIGSVSETSTSSGDLSADALTNRSSNTQRIGANYGYAANVLTIVRRSLDEILLPNSYVERSVRYFVEPHGFVEAKRILNDRRVLVLVSDPDRGRHDAALNALDSMGGLAIREVKREPGESVRITEIPTRSNAGWILDLRQDETVPSSLGRDLASPETRQTLEVSKSYLIVILSPRLWNECSAGGNSLQHYLRRPSALSIIQRRLNGHLPEDVIHRWLGDERIRQRLADATPTDALEWVSRILEVQAIPNSTLTLPKSLESDPNEDDFQAARVRTALEAASNWRTHLLDWYRNNEDCQTRDYLVAAAILEWHGAGDIFTAADRLSAALKGPAHNSSGQQGPGVLELIDRIGAEHNGTYLKFDKLGYREAVLDYVWADRPHLQTNLLKWMCDESLRVPEDPALSDRVVAYVLRWTLRSKDLCHLKEVAYSWSSYPELRSRAVDLFTAAALDSELGKAVRDLLLDWSKPEADVSGDLRALTAEICGGHLALVYKKMMLFRLGNLASIEDDRISQAAQHKISSLWDNVKLRSEIVSHVLRWLSSKDRTIEAGRSTFTVLMSINEQDTQIPAILSYVSTNPEQLDALARGLRVVLEYSPLEREVSLALWSWLTAATRNVEVRQIFESLAVAASAPRGPSDYDAQARIALLDTVILWLHNCPHENQAAAEQVHNTVTKRLVAFDPYRNRQDVTGASQISYQQNVVRDGQ